MLIEQVINSTGSFECYNKKLGGYPKQGGHRLRMCTVANVIAESAMHDSMLKVLEIAEAKRGRIADASVRN